MNTGVTLVSHIAGMAVRFRHGLVAAPQYKSGSIPEPPPKEKARFRGLSPAFANPLKPLPRAAEL